MNRNERHFTRFMRIALMLLMLTPTPAVWAQSPASQPATAQDVTIIIQQQQVRFTAQRAVEQMQLQVFNQSGELTFDSGLITVNEINWPFQNANGEPIKSGLYAYTLSIKEAGAETARVRRGHFIVDRAQDRDGSTDKLWVTSQNDNGVGTELTVARDENSVVAGTTTNSERALGQRAESQNRGAGERGVETEAQNQTAAMQSAAAITAGTVGQIAKFTSATDLGNSVISEESGNVGIGPTSPVTKLDVRGHLTLDAGSDPALYTAAAGWEQNRYLMLLNSPSYQSASGLKAGGILVSDSYAFANPGKNDLVVKGNVGIGTANPRSKLEIDGQDALTITGFEPFLTIRDSSLTGGNFGPPVSKIQYAHGDLAFGSGLKYVGRPGYGFAPRMAIRRSGIMSLVNSPTWTSNGWGGSMELENGSAIGWKANEAGNRFGIGHTNGGLYFFRTASDPATTDAPAVYDMSISDTGVVSVRTLQIDGGADFAENFDVNVAATSGEAETMKVEPGMVVSIDPASPGKLQLSTQTYDYQVAGIISGAGGVKPGMVMSQEGTLAEGKHPVALSGRVYCWADASNGPIKPGDLLTTSDTPGHAMKVTDRVKAQGAIIGKAMTSLKEGKGLVLVLVTLQ